MSWVEVTTCIKLVGNALHSGGKFIIYGPFNINGDYTAASNKNFDAMLKQTASHMGIRNLEDITQQCYENQLAFKQKIKMPANNFILLFEKISID